MENTNDSKMKEICLAGGCFWGVETYMSRIFGVVRTNVGYANGNVENPNYKLVCSGVTGFAEAVMVEYDSELTTLNKLLISFFKMIDPTALNKQGNDIGTQYRTGIYCKSGQDKMTAMEEISKLQMRYNKPIAVEVSMLKNYYLAEDYHQKYLEKNPNGYCHVDLDGLENPIIEPGAYTKPSDEVLKMNLSELAYKVTQLDGTEPPFSSEYTNYKGRGIYVDAVTGEPLFASNDKFDSGCGWPSFSKPITPAVIKQREDRKLGMIRTEVRSQGGNSHLGHVFDDGPAELGGLRFCINGAALRFIAYEEMEAQGYGFLKHVVK